MQAHPQSSPAARNLPATLKASRNAARPSIFPVQKRLRRVVPAVAGDSLRPADAALATYSSEPIPGERTVHSPAFGIAQGAGLAHDAGNLLGALGLYCDLLRAPGVLRPEHAHYAAELSLISSRSTELIRRLLAAPLESAAAAQAGPGDTALPVPGSRSDASGFQPAAVRRRDAAASETVRPGLMHAATVRNLAPVLQRIAAGSARVLVSSPAVLPPLDLSAETLERITVNLVRNAAQAIRQKRATSSAPAAGEIRVTLALAANRLQLTVEDNGPGLTASAANAFMHPSALPPNSRNGHGHRIIHELVSDSGGQLSIRVRPGQGTTFCLKWPLPMHDAAPRIESFDTTFETASGPLLPLPCGPCTSGLSLAPPTLSLQEGPSAC